MMDSNEINKIMGAVIGSLLVFLLLGFFAGKLYGTRDSAHHGDEVLAFALEVDGGDAEPEDTGVDMAALVAEADPGRGAKVFSKCKGCHKLADGANGVGPHLWNLVGRQIGGVAGFGYSSALSGHGGEWDLDALDGFLENPSGWAPGTAMSFKGLAKPEDRVNLIAYINAEGDAPADLAAMAGGGDEDASEDEASEDEAAEGEAGEAEETEDGEGEAEGEEAETEGDEEADSPEDGDAETGEEG